MAVLECTCENENQDIMYGKGMRVHNEGKSGWKCTVCGKVKSGK